MSAGPYANVARDALMKLARALYDACPTPKPTWEQLGDVTRSTWLESAREEEHAQGPSTDVDSL